MLPVIELPWPHADLRPNSRVHWGKKSRAAKRARLDAQTATLAAGIRGVAADAVNVTVTFAPPDASRRDLDNMLASLKAGLDGIADAIGVDDSRWSLTLRKAEPRRPHGAVLIQIEAA